MLDWGRILFGLIAIGSAYWLGYIMGRGGRLRGSQRPRPELWRNGPRWPQP